MRRRDFLSLISAAAVAGEPFFAGAQQRGKTYRVAIVSVSVPVTEMSETGFEPYRTFLGELRRLGYVEGENLVVERYSAEGHSERYREIVSEVARRRPDAVLAIGSGIVLEFKAQTATIPIVGFSSDPLALGIVRSLARPESNITGVSIDGGIAFWGKSLGLLKEAIPKLSRVGLLVGTTGADGQQVAAAVKEAADTMGISIVGSPLDGPVDETAYRLAFADMMSEGAEAVYVSAGRSAFFTDRRLIVSLIEKHGLPAIYPYHEYVEIGGLMAYAADVPDLFLHAADQIDQILKGNKPSDIPLYQARKFHLAINLKTAKALGIEIPVSLLARADEVIE
jgi:putative ABC transport system substrate-binding protein